MIKSARIEDSLQLAAGNFNIFLWIVSVFITVFMGFRSVLMLY